MKRKIVYGTIVMRAQNYQVAQCLYVDVKTNERAKRWKWSQIWATDKNPSVIYRINLHGQDTSEHKYTY